MDDQLDEVIKVLLDAVDEKMRADIGKICMWPVEQRKMLLTVMRLLIGEED